MRRRLVPALLLVLGVAVAPSASAVPVGAERAAAPLAGRTVVIDPGHQLGNRNFPARINAPVPAGGFTKPCNTTGTATAGGYPEATFTWQVSRRVVRQLRVMATARRAAWLTSLPKKAAVSGTAPGTLISMRQNIKRKVPLNAPTSA